MNFAASDLCCATCAWWNDTKEECGYISEQQDFPTPEEQAVTSAADNAAEAAKLAAEQEAIDRAAEEQELIRLHEELENEVEELEERIARY